MTKFLSVSVCVFLLSLGYFVTAIFAVPMQNKSTKKDPSKIKYKPFEDKLDRYVWKGKKVVLLTAKKELDKVTISKIIGTIDSAYDYYAKLNAREPEKNPNYMIEGRATIAEVFDTCGAGCGMPGTTGIEITPEHFGILYDGVRTKNEYDQALFYELGRNFWFYDSQLEYKEDPDYGLVSTGYAVLMRFIVMEAISVKGGPWNGNSFVSFRKEVEGLLQRYLDDPSLTWANTLAIKKAPQNPIGLGATDLWASFLFALRKSYGDDEFIKKFLAEVKKRPATNTTQEAVDNFIISASKAANTNLTQLFKKWRWPISDQARHELNKYPFKSQSQSQKF